MSDYLDAAKKVLAKQVNSSRKDHVSEPISVLSIGCLIYWRSMNGKLNGPAVIEGVFQDGATTWCWFCYEQTEHLMQSSLIEHIERRQ